jgi:hypothetical protein
MVLRGTPELSIRNHLLIDGCQNTSEWSRCLLVSMFCIYSCDLALDYPPFFAYFEYLLSIPASLIDSKMVDLNNLGYDAWSVIAYQRTTVIVTELVMALALRSSVASFCLQNITNIYLIDSFQEAYTLEYNVSFLRHYSCIQGSS